MILVGASFRYKSKIDNLDCFCLSHITLNAVSGIAAALHRDDDVSQNLDVVDLVIQIIESVSFVNAVFDQNHAAFRNGSASIQKGKSFVVKQILFDEGLHPLVVFGWGNFSNASAVTFVGRVLETLRFGFV